MSYLITAYRIRTEGQPTVISKKHKRVNSHDDIERFEYRTAVRYILKDDQPHDCDVIYRQLFKRR